MSALSSDALAPLPPSAWHEHPACRFADRDLFFRRTRSGRGRGRVGQGGEPDGKSTTS